ncbi:integral membrane protein, YccS/YhfK family [Marinibacterium anthonyi]|nr:integral membrane protein, YccS/YhfK family [Marinibacterium anthonyi]
MTMSRPSPRSQLPTRRIDAVRQLLDPRLLRDSIALGAQPWQRIGAIAGLQAALTVGIALPLVHLSPWSGLIGYASLGALVALFGRFAPARRRNWIVLQAALCQVLAVFCMSLAAWAGAGPLMLLALLGVACGIFFFVSVTCRFGPPGALIFAFAAGAGAVPAATFADVLHRSLATAAVAALALLICALTERFRDASIENRPLPVDPMRPLGHRLIAAVRIAAGCALAAFACHAIGGNHPLWSAMGALAVLQGAQLHLSLNRAIQRMAGSVGGAVVAWVILTQDPSLGVIVIALMLLQFGTELIIGSNYGLGQVLVTPMALLMSDLAMPAAGGAAMVPERVLDTILGATIGLLAAIVLSTLDDREHLARIGAGRGFGQGVDRGRARPDRDRLH